MAGFNGLNMGLGNLWQLSNAKTRSFSAENPAGEKGKGAMAEAAPDGPARELGRGWKCRAWIPIEPGTTVTIADVDGPGAIQSIWLTGNLRRDMILRIYWDNQATPSVACPVADFFGAPWVTPADFSAKGNPIILNSLPVCVNPSRGMNCFWEMPFRKHCKITMENRDPKENLALYYQINYTLTEVPDDAAYFHAQWRRVNPLPYGQVYTILDGVRGKGHYVGTVMGWGINNNRWWGEGEVKFFIDGDGEFPTICGTGTEDYFGGAYNWDVAGQYTPYTTPFLGMHQVIRPDGTYNAQHRHAMYRWHIMDPVRFDQDLKVTMQALGWRSEGRFLPGTHDMCSVAYWYQTLPAAPFPPLPDRNGMEIV